MTKKVIIFDIDGTLANCEHRQHHVRQKPKRWDLFNKNMVHDTPHGDIVWLFKVLQEHNDTTMLIASGRGEEDREKTVQWLTDHEIWYENLYMRPAKDSRSDDIIKFEILNQIRAEHGEPWLWMDDRQQVVNAIRAQGVRVLQVAPGDF